MNTISDANAEICNFLKLISQEQNIFLNKT